MKNRMNTPFVDVTDYDCELKSSEYYPIREFNRGKSFEFDKWKKAVKYTNDSFVQDFVVYNNAFLACKKTHISQSPPVLQYSDTGEIVGVNSPE